MAATIRLLSVILLSDEFEEVTSNDVGDEELAKSINQLRQFGKRNNIQSTYQTPLSPSDGSPSRPKNQKVETLEKKLAETVAACNDSKLSFENDMKSIMERMEEANSRNAEISSHVQKVDEDLTRVFLKGDKHEAWSRRNILLLIGLREKRGENTNQIAVDLIRDMGIDISLDDICRSHRNGPRLKGRHRPIFVKFVRHDIRDKVYFARDNLRHIHHYRSVFIDENLTKYRSRLFREVRKEKLWQSWTYDGSIYCCRRGDEPRNSRTFKIVKITDFEKLFGRHPFNSTATV